jgi:hypothetical protein
VPKQSRMSPSHQLHRTRPQRYLIRTIAVESQLDSVARNTSQEDLGDAHGVNHPVEKETVCGRLRHESQPRRRHSPRQQALRRTRRRAELLGLVVRNRNGMKSSPSSSGCFPETGRIAISHLGCDSLQAFSTTGGRLFETESPISRESRLHLHVSSRESRCSPPPMPVHYRLRSPVPSHLLFVVEE